MKWHADGAGGWDLTDDLGRYGRLVGWVLADGRWYTVGHLGGRRGRSDTVDAAKRALLREVEAALWVDAAEGLFDP